MGWSHQPPTGTCGPATHSRSVGWELGWECPTTGRVSDTPAPCQHRPCWSREPQQVPMGTTGTAGPRISMGPFFPTPRAAVSVRWERKGLSSIRRLWRAPGWHKASHEAP